MPSIRPAAPVTLDAVELRVLHMPLVSPFTTSFGTETVREVIIVTAETPDGRGWGEVVTQSEPSYSSEYTQGAWDVLTRFLAPALLGRRIVAPEEVAGALHRIVGHRMAKAGLELAVLDAALRAEGRSFAQYLGSEKTRVPSGVSVGIQSDPAALVDTVGGYLDEGTCASKSRSSPVATSTTPPPSARVRADPAAGRRELGLHASGCRHPRRTRPLRALLIEQPLQEDDLVDHATLAKRLTTPVCLDESIVSDKAAADALALGSAAILNIKAGRVGGYLEAVAIHDRALAAGVPVWCGGMLETGIGRAANAALAALPGFTLPGDISASARFYDRDIVTEPAVLDDGYVRVPTGPGVGVEIDTAALERFTVRRERITR